MDIFDSLLNSGGRSEDSSSSFIDAAKIVIGENGNLGDLVSQFTNKGLGDIIQSWVGTGKNAQITSSQLTDVLGSEKIEKIADAIGFPSSTVPSILAGFLPGIIDKLTPEGKLPEGNIFDKGKDLLNLF
ncbi:MAG: DUF937 domain-containing protein [Melioribacteraceae bacterium]|jgi:uncharacterized protein YidB (DUF937 family)|nr:DUF937 domain-containing protein [Melioribacteraceae bacterium]